MADVRWVEYFADAATIATTLAYVYCLNIAQNARDTLDGYCQKVDRRLKSDKMELELVRNLYARLKKASILGGAALVSISVVAGVPLTYLVATGNSLWLNIAGLASMTIGYAAAVIAEWKLEDRGAGKKHSGNVAKKATAVLLAAAAVAIFAFTLATVRAKKIDIFPEKPKATMKESRKQGRNELEGRQDWRLAQRENGRCSFFDEVAKPSKPPVAPVREVRGRVPVRGNC
ncbi:Uncharacterised protein [Candidatus Gugararchaeum adminiculabundum]|nr:Uncharacterised protein [Candidatus Gugararchaeum adminiculabundum]